VTQPSVGSPLGDRPPAHAIISASAFAGSRVAGRQTIALVVEGDQRSFPVS
jgi:hypothetical protein